MYNAKIRAGYRNAVSDRDYERYVKENLADSPFQIGDQVVLRDWILTTEVIGVKRETKYQTRAYVGYCLYLFVNDKRIFWKYKLAVDQKWHNGFDLSIRPLELNDLKPGLRFISSELPNQVWTIIGLTKGELISELSDAVSIFTFPFVCFLAKNEFTTKRFIAVQDGCQWQVESINDNVRTLCIGSFEAREWKVGNKTALD